jgi:SAM-dependent methyltransferase
MSTDAIAKRFSTGARHYDAFASVQYQLAAGFMRWLCEDGPASYTARQALQITELGCGTGFLTQRIIQAFPLARVSACDVSANMLAQCQIRTQGAASLHLADAAAFSTQQQADWVVSSFCLQWVKDIKSALAFHASNTRRLSICLPCSGSFSNWRLAHERSGLGPALWPLPNAVELAQYVRQLANEHNARARIWVGTVDEQHDSPLAFARHLRAIGADYTGERNKGAALRRVLELLPTPYTADYEVLMVDVTGLPVNKSS